MLTLAPINRMGYYITEAEGIVMMLKPTPRTMRDAGRTDIGPCRTLAHDGKSFLTHTGESRP